VGVNISFSSAKCVFFVIMLLGEMRISQQHVVIIGAVVLISVIALIVLSKMRNHAHACAEGFQQTQVLKHIRHVYIKTQGIGDFIRGSFALAKFCKQNGLSFDIDYSQHNINNYLINKNMRTEISTDKNRLIDVTDIMHFPALESTLKDSMKTALSDVLYVNTCNTHVDYPIDEDIRTFIRNSFLPNEKIQKAVEDMQLQLLGSKKPYGIIHARLGDSALNGASPESEYANIASEINVQKRNIDPSLPVLAISDDAKFKEYLQKYGVIPIPTKPAHTTSANDLTDTMVDLFVLCGANIIIQHSVYRWGSGFSDRAADMYNIKVYKTKESTTQ
jgi:hypothetical protein